MKGLESKTEAMETLTHQLEDSFATLVTKESFWEVMTKRLKWHVERLTHHCSETEQATDAATAPRLSSEAKEHISGHSQRVAKILAAQADSKVLREMVSIGRPEAATEYAVQWDSMVDGIRDSLVEEFLVRVKDSAAKANPFNDIHVQEARTKFCTILALALRCALSKFQRIMPAETILGRRGLKGLGFCAACDRPFAHQPGKGDERAKMTDPGAVVATPPLESLDQFSEAQSLPSRARGGYGGHGDDARSVESSAASTGMRQRGAGFKVRKRAPKGPAAFQDPVAEEDDDMSSVSSAMSLMSTSLPSLPSHRH